MNNGHELQGEENDAVRAIASDLFGNVDLSETKNGKE